MNEHTQEASFYQPLPLSLKSMRGSSPGGFPPAIHEGSCALGSSLSISASQHEVLPMASYNC